MVSILMPCLNAGSFLVPALDSLLSQDWSDLEVIVADGGSRDNSLETLREIASRDPRVRWISSPDEGPADAVNKAAALAKGEFVGWLNADDVYAAGAVSCAVAKFHSEPSLLMLYGEGEFIDAEGLPTGPYPTMPPTAGIDSFAEGCFICQPTVFMRKDAWRELGGLDTSFEASFDFDLWLRAFKAWPSRIGFCDRVLARSRMHSATITHRKRKQVALEGLAILRKHLGVAPHHWILTHFEEVIAEHPDGGATPLQAKLYAALEEARPMLSEEDYLLVAGQLAADKRVGLSHPRSGVDVHADGWAGPTLTARIDHAGPCTLQLVCDNSSPCSRKLDLLVTSPDGIATRTNVNSRGRFVLHLHAESRGEQKSGVFKIEAQPSFRPSAIQRDSVDHRDLCYRVIGAELLS